MAVKKIPSMTLDLGYQTFEVDFVPEISGSDGFGAISIARGQVLVRTEPATLTDAEVANTLVHEMCHAIYRLRDVQMGDCEERVVTSFANGFIELLRRNPHFMDWLREKLE